MFGATAAKPGGTGFGGFGTSTSATPSFGFGTTPAATATTASIQPSTGFQLGGTGFQQSATQPTTGLTFGQPATSAQPLTGLSFGTNTSASSGFALGGASTATPSLFATPTATPSFGLGAATTSAAPTLGFYLGQPSQPASTGGFTLGATAAPSLLGSTTSAPTLNFGLGSTTTSTPGLSLGGGGGLFGASSSTGLSTATSTSATVGLGGVDSSSSKLGLSGPGAVEQKHVKDHLLPEPLLQTFNDFEAFVKQQKQISSDISRSNSQPIKRVQEVIETMEVLLARITNGLTMNAVATDKLKVETAQGLSNVDMAQRLRETPTAVGVEDGPDQYFSDLVSRFETDASRLKAQVEDAERHMRSISQNSAISPQELTLAMRRIHESLVALAARVQTQHVQTLGAAEQYRYLRHVYLKEDMPAVPKPAGANWRQSGQRSLAGPTAFCDTSGVANLSADALSMLSGSVPVAPPVSTSGWFGPPAGNSGGPFGSLSPPALNSSVDNSAGLQLAKPPVGNKRNKR